jgi:uncharacterized RDD family membrane protein YckC
MQDSSMAMPPGTGVAMGYAGLGSRFVALLIDGIIVSVIGGIIGLIFGSSPGEPNGVVSVINLVIGAAYYIYFIGSSGLTLGGRVLGCKVVDYNGQQPSYGTAAIRWLMSIVSAAVLFIGYIWAFFDKNKQTWHDKVARTYVVKP